MLPTNSHWPLLGLHVKFWHFESEKHSMGVYWQPPSSSEHVSSVHGFVSLQTTGEASQVPSTQAYVVQFVFAVKNIFSEIRKTKAFQKRSHSPWLFLGKGRKKEDEIWEKEKKEEEMLTK